MSLDNRELILRRGIPVVINSYNQPGYLANIIHRFRVNHFRNLIVSTIKAVTIKHKNY